MGAKKGTETATIDVCLVTIKTRGETPKEYGISTATKIGLEVQSETVDAQKLIVKGVLISQKGEQTTITGNKITVTDNVFIPEVAEILQGGTITYDTGTPTKIIGYQPPVAGSTDKGEVFDTCCYSAQYDASGQIIRYELIEYPNCTGTPIALNSEDGAFRAPEYVINSAPNTGEAPYKMSWPLVLPSLT